jgi:hypothetical protein
MTHGRQICQRTEGRIEALGEGVGWRFDSKKKVGRSPIWIGGALLIGVGDEVMVYIEARRC